MRRIAAFVCALALGGCMSFDVLEAELPKYRGKHIETLVSKLGLPNAEQQIMGRRVYIWNSSTPNISIDPAITTSVGFIGTQPVTITNTNYQADSSQLSCTIRAFVDGENIITGGDYGGNNGACFNFSRRLEK